MTLPRHAAVAGLLVTTLLVSACAGRTVTTTSARRADALGLDAAERDAFTREVQACMGTEPVGPRAVAPSTTLSVGAEAEAPTGSVGGLAAVSAAATAAVTGIAYRAYHWWRHRRASPAPPTSVDVDPPVTSRSSRTAGVAASPARASRGSDVVASNRSDVVASGRSEGAPATPTIASCLDVVTARWRARGATGAQVQGS